MSIVENNRSHCLKCKIQVDIINPEVKTTKNNRSMLCGNCSVCNTKCCRFLKKQNNKLDEYLVEDKKEDDDVKADDKKEDTVKDIIDHLEKKIKKVRGNKKKLLE